MAAFEVLDFWPDWDAAAGGAAVTVTWSAAGSTAAPSGPPCVMFGDALARPFSWPSAASVSPACRMPHGRHPPCIVPRFWSRVALPDALRSSERLRLAAERAMRAATAAELRLLLDTFQSSSASRRPRRCPPRCCARACCAVRRRRTRRAPCGCAWRWTATRARAATRCPSASGRPPQRPRTPTRAPPASRHAQANPRGAIALTAPPSHRALCSPAADRRGAARLHRVLATRRASAQALSPADGDRACEVVCACQPRQVQRCHVCHV